MSSNKKRRSSALFDSDDGGLEDSEDECEMEDAGGFEDSEDDDAGDIHSKFERLTAAAAEALNLSQLGMRRSDQLKRAARLKLDEACQLEIEAEELDNQGGEIWANAFRDKHEARSLHFQAILVGLESNNKAILTAINTNESDGLRYPDGYGAALGQALSKNDVVTDLELDLGNFLSDKTQKAIRKELGDDEKWKALLFTEMNPLMDFLAKSPSLQRCTVHGDDTHFDDLFYYVAVQMRDWVMNQLGQSSSLRELSWCTSLSPWELSCFMRVVSQPRKRLKRLTIDLKLLHLDGLDMALQNKDIAEAFGDQKTLQHLTLGGLRHEYKTARSILGQLHQVKSLQSLRLVSWLPPVGEKHENMIHSISRYLKKSSANGNTPLQRLELDQFTVVEADMIELLKGLVRHASNGNDDDDDSRPISSITVSSLRLTKCSWPDPGALGRLTAFLQRRTTNDNAINLRELHIGCQNPSLGHYSSLRLADSLMKQRKTGQLYPTVGSQLVTLGLDHVKRNFFTHLGSVATRAMSSLQELHLCGMSKEASVAFAECLPKLTMIRMLSLEQVAKDATKDVLHGLESNTSVVDVITTASSGFDADEERKIQSYCRRNRTAATAESSGRLLPYPALLPGAQQVPNAQEEMLRRGKLSPDPIRNRSAQNRGAKRRRPS